MITRKIPLIVTAFLFIFSTALLATTKVGVKVIGTSTTKAIDTLTLTDNGPSPGEVSAAGTTVRVCISIDSGNSAVATRDAVVNQVGNQANCTLFRIQALGPDRFEINATGGRNIVSIKMNSLEVLGSVPSLGGQTYQRDDSSLNPDLPACGKVPALSTYGLIILALLLAGTAVWLFRKRVARTA